MTSIQSASLTSTFDQVRPSIGAVGLPAVTRMADGRVILSYDIMAVEWEDFVARMNLVESLGYDVVPAHEFFVYDEGSGIVHRLLTERLA